MSEAQPLKKKENGVKYRVAAQLKILTAMEDFCIRCDRDANNV